MQTTPAVLRDDNRVDDGAVAWMNPQSVSEVLDLK
jgi:hypothetical protein